MRIDAALIAYHAADECRALVTATAEPVNYTDVATMRAVTEGLYLTTSLLPIAVEQLSAGLRTLEEQGLRTVDGSDPTDSTSTALRALLNAREALVVARQELRTAEDSMARLKATQPTSLTSGQGAAAAP